MKYKWVVILPYMVGKPKLKLSSRILQLTFEWTFISHMQTKVGNPSGSLHHMIIQEYFMDVIAKQGSVLMPKRVACREDWGNALDPMN